MPVLQKIVVQDFRNIAFQELHFSPNVNCISGNNGEGKTNLMDAIWYLSMTKSAFSTSDKYNFRTGTRSFAISGTYLMEGGLSTRFSVESDDSGTKKIRREDKQYTRFSEHIGTLPIVMVSPSDITLVSESGEEKRRFVNSVISQIDRGYLHDLQQYNKLLFQRNKLLKDSSGDAGLLDVLDDRLSQYAIPVYQARKRLALEMEPVVAEYYKSLSGGLEAVSVKYKSDLDKGSLADSLRAGREKDRFLGFTTCGVHRDDFLFLMDGRPIRRYGSQGQQKSFLVSLKFAQYDIMKQSCGFAPILLLDDVFDKLDMNRISNLLSMVSGSDFGQIFITDSNKVRMASVVDGFTSDRSYFECSGGTFREVGQ